MAAPNPELTAWLVRVNISCQDCAKKVRKTLMKIEGVKNVEFRGEQNCPDNFEIGEHQVRVTMISSVLPMTIVAKLKLDLNKVAHMLQQLPPPAQGSGAPAQSSAAPPAQRGGGSKAHHCCTIM